MNLKSILVPIDFSKDSIDALKYAREFAQLFGAELLLLHVVEPIYYASPADMYASSPNLAMLIDEQRHIGIKQLARLQADLAKQGQTVHTLLQTGSAAQVIADIAKRRKAGLIIMSTHGRTGLAHVLMGSVAERVVRTAPCPVLTVRGGKTSKATRGTKSRKKRK